MYIRTYLFTGTSPRSVATKLISAKVSVFNATAEYVRLVHNHVHRYSYSVMNGIFSTTKT